MYYTRCAHAGERTNGRMEGRGKFTFANGNYYIGGFLDGAFHGEGAIYFTPENGGGTYQATWAHGVAQEGTYFFHDGLKYEQEGWDYCTPQDRRFWREHNSFIVPPFAGPKGSLIVPDYGEGRVLEVRPRLEDWTQVDAPSPDGRGTPAQLAFLRLPPRIESGHPFTIVVEVQDKFGDCVIRARKMLDLELAAGSGQFLHDGEEETQKGRVEFQCRYKGEGPCSFRALCQNLPSLESPELEAVVTSPYAGDLRPILLQLEGVPPTVVEGEEFSVSVCIMDLDSRKPLEMENGTMNVVMMLKSGSGRLEGTVRTTNDGCSLLYYDLVYHGPGPFTLTCVPITADTHVSESGPIQVTPADANITPTQVVVVSVNPLDPIRGQPLEVQAVLWDDRGRLAIRADDFPVSLRLGIGNGELEGADAVPTTGGFAAFEGVTYVGLDPFTLVATAAGLRDSGHSKVLMAQTPIASLDVVAVQPRLQPPGEPYSVCVVAYDEAGAVVAAPDVALTLSLAEGAGTLTGTLVAAAAEAVGGYYTFSDVRFEGRGPFRLCATADTGLASDPSPQLLFAGPAEDALALGAHFRGEARQLCIIDVQPHEPAPDAPVSLEVEVQDAFGDVCPEAVSVVNVVLVMDAPLTPAVLDGGQVEVAEGRAKVTLPGTGRWPFLVHIWAEAVGGVVSGLIGRRRRPPEADVPTHLHVAHLSRPVRAGEPFQAVVEVRNAAGGVVPGAEAFVRLRGVGLPPVLGVPHVATRLGYAVFNGCSFPVGTDVSRGALQALADGLPPSAPVALVGGAASAGGEAEEGAPDAGDMLVFGFLPTRPCLPNDPFLVEVRVLDTQGALCLADDSSAVTVSLVEGSEGTLSGDCTVVVRHGIARFALRYSGGRSFHLVASAGRLVACRTERPVPVALPLPGVAADEPLPGDAEEEASPEESAVEGAGDTPADAEEGPEEVPASEEPADGEAPAEEPEAQEPEDTEAGGTEEEAEAPEPVEDPPETGGEADPSEAEDPVAEAAPDPDAEADAEANAEANADEAPEAESNAKADEEAEAEGEAGPPAEVEAAAETEVEAEAEGQAEGLEEAEAEGEAEAEAEGEVAAEVDGEEEVEADAEVDGEAEAEVEGEAEAEAEAEARPASDEDEGEGEGEAEDAGANDEPSGGEGEDPVGTGPEETDEGTDDAPPAEGNGEGEQNAESIEPEPEAE
eukprot:EG_transcript_756